ncbi:hypothetical protein [Dipodfec virus UOA04_Rod_682]|nr:hypothetical protein [Dipodfec virus UOA04_Rod_682]
MKRYSTRNGNGFARFGTRDPHYLNRVNNYRGGQRL